jgi:hypothetical protein
MNETLEIETDEVTESKLRKHHSVVRVDVAVRTEPHGEPHISIKSKLPVQVARQVLIELEGRVDLERRGIVGEVVANLDDGTWEYRRYA